MSSRLILLPKKSYTPWNPENVARVERDEARAKEEEELKLQKEQERESELRMSKLRAGGGEGAEVEQQHVNLFHKEQEEKEEQKYQELIHGSGTKNNKEALEDKNYLGASVLRQQRETKEHLDGLLHRDNNRSMKGEYRRDRKQHKREEKSISSVVGVFNYDHSHINQGGGEGMMKKEHRLSDKRMKDALDPMAVFIKQGLVRKGGGSSDDDYYNKSNHQQSSKRRANHNEYGSDNYSRSSSTSTTTTTPCKNNSKTKLSKKRRKSRHE